MMVNEYRSQATGPLPRRFESHRPPSWPKPQIDPSKRVSPPALKSRLENVEKTLRASLPTQRNRLKTVERPSSSKSAPQWPQTYPLPPKAPRAPDKACKHQKLPRLKHSTSAVQSPNKKESKKKKKKKKMYTSGGGK